MQQNTPFIFNSKNADFVTGKRKRPARESSLFFFGLIAPALGAFILYFLFLDDFIQQWQVDQAFKTVDAVVTDGESTTRYLIFSSYELDYEYRVNGVRYTGDQSVGGDLWENIFIGDEIPIRYSVDDPSRSYVEGHGVFSQGRLLWTIMAVGFGSLFILMGIGTVIGWLNNRRLGSRGAILQGRLITARTSPSANRMVNYNVQFEFLSPDGIRIEGKRTFLIPAKRAPRPPAPGTPVLILYENEKRYMLL